MLGKNGIFRGKSFEKSFFSTNSAEFSAENHFPQKKMYEKSAPGHPGWDLAFRLATRPFPDLKNVLHTHSNYLNVVGLALRILLAGLALRITYNIKMSSSGPYSVQSPSLRSPCPPLCILFSGSRWQWQKFHRMR
jgi:hypothetical protein